VLSSLAGDPSEQVRSWLAVNYFVPQDAFETLTHDSSAAVRALVGWKRSLADA
jgi:hypothetical protein